MDGLLVLIVMFAGAAIALLGFFLIASERDLKVKRREVEALLAKLENTTGGHAETAAQPDHGAGFAELRAKNQELQNQAAGLTAKLELSRRTIEELQSSQQSHAGDDSATQELRAANDRLTFELNQLRSRLQASEAQLQGSAALSGSASQYDARTEQEIADLRHQLEQSHVKIRDLENARQHLPNLDEIEARHSAERQNLEARISALNREISAGREKLTELETLRGRAAEAEQAQQTLREENRRHEEQASRWQASLAEAEEHRQRLSALQAPLNNLLAKHAALAEQQREFEAHMTALHRLVAAPAQSTDAMNSTTTASASTAFGDRVVELQQPAAAEQPAPQKNRRFGIFSVVFLLAAGGVFGAWYFNADSTQPELQSSALSTQQQSMRVPAPMEISSRTDVPPATTKPPTPVAIQPAVKETPRPAVKANRDGEGSPAAPATAGPVTYEITRTSRVYTAPSELSQPLGDIEPGTKVNVVSSRDGWLEIHSKHGRPPGFIRREAAARTVAQN